MDNIKDLSAGRIRSESRYIYFATLLVLIYCEHQIIGLLYFCYARNLIFKLEFGLKWEEDVYEDVYSIDELELIDWHYDSLVQNIKEKINLPNNYPIIYTFQNILEIIPHNRYKKKECFEVVNTQKKVQKLAKYKVKLTDQFLNYFKRGSKDTWKILKFKKTVYNINKYLSELEIYRGLYYFTRYEYELILVNNVDLYLLFLEYELILDVKINSYSGSSLVTYNLYDIKNQIKKFSNLAIINDDLITKQIKIRQQIFSQKKQNDNEKLI